MNKLLLALAMLAVFTAPTFAESAHDICTTEIRDAGIVDQDEINIYMKECVSQVSAELEANQENNESEVENTPSQDATPEES